MQRLSFCSHVGLLLILISLRNSAAQDAGNSKVLGMVTKLERELNSAVEDGDTSAKIWENIKWLPPWAPYRVQGLPIEDLEPEMNFRRGYALGKVEDVEDKTQILPFLRPVHDEKMAKRKRRVLLDLGGKTFDSSVLWFIQMYPLTFTEIHVFEVTKNRFQIPTSRRSIYSKKSPGLHVDHFSHVSNSDKELPQELLSMIHLWEKYVDTEDQPPNKINITRFIKDTLRLTPNDTVVVKMDIEDAEWRVLPEWMRDPEMPLIVDDLFIEIHYNDPSMHSFGWRPNSFRHTRAEATELFMQLREKGFYAHPWP